MKELAYERDFRRWALQNGCGWEDLSYPRPQASGATIGYRLSPPDAPRGVVLISHGAGNDSLFGFVGLFKALLQQGYEVFTFDLDGHGRRGTTLFSTEALRSAIPDAIRQARAGERGLSLHAIGVSLGGSILLGSLGDLDRAPSSVTLISAPLQVQLSRATIRGELRLPLARTLWRERSHYGLTGLIPSFGPFKRDTYPLRLGMPSGEGAFGYVSAINHALTGLRLEEVARRVTSPVLLIYGEDDRLVPIGQGRHLASLLPRSELLALPDETHLTVPLAPRAVDRLSRWIDEHATPPDPDQNDR